MGKKNVGLCAKNTSPFWRCQLAASACSTSCAPRTPQEALPEKTYEMHSALSSSRPSTASDRLRVEKSGGVLLFVSVSIFMAEKYNAKQLTPRCPLHLAAPPPNPRPFSPAAPLLEAGCAAMASRGVRTVDLFVESTNSAALALYARHGFTTVGAVRALHLDTAQHSASAD